MNILDAIVARKKEEIAASKVARPLDQLKKDASTAGAPRGFCRALTHSPEPIAIIAEVKKKSPSRGILCAEFEPTRIAKSYEAGGASAVSVLTDTDFFGGSLGDLKAVRAAVKLPVLRKDFMLEEYQVWEARAAGADAILLIAAILETTQIKSLKSLAESLGMDALIEVHSAEELDKIASVGSALIGINNRDLRTFDATLETTEKLAARAAPGSTLVSESGIFTASDLKRLAACGVRAALIGESLVTQTDPAAALKKLLTSC